MGKYNLHLGDCLAILPKMIDEGIQVDAVITDPPYGIGFDYASYDDTISNWEHLINTTLPLLRQIGTFVVMPAAAINRLGWWYANHPPDWIISWHKGSPGHRSKIGFNSWEPLVCFGRPVRPMHDAFSTPLNAMVDGHPCPKPTAWARWLVGKSTRPGDTVLDPFMGSGTTGVACMQLGRKFIGVEIDDGYFKVAEGRIGRAALQPILMEGGNTALRQGRLFAAGE